MSKEPSENFRYDDVDTDTDKLCEQMASVKLTQSQAIAVLVWHRSETDSAVSSNIALTIGRVIGLMLKSTNVLMDVHSLAIAAGLDQVMDLGSESQVARKLGCTRAAVSKCVNKWKDVLGYTVTKFTRSDENRENCSTAQKKDHWRHRKTELSHA